MCIEEKTVYVTRGQSFDSLEKAERFRADLIGEFMDRMQHTLTPRDRLELNKYLTDKRNRAVLLDLLDY